jgi:hypothetical protein
MCMCVKSSLVMFILLIIKEASPASILGLVWYDASSRTFLTGPSVLLYKHKILAKNESRVFPAVRAGDTRVAICTILASW